jgi:ABC-type uncharacterized transport system ATPase subunit
MECLCLRFGKSVRASTLFAPSAESPSTHSGGEILGFLGPNGAGKKTTIRMIMGILQRDQGEIRFALNGRSNQVNKERIGYLPEERGLYGDTKVLETLVYFAGLKGSFLRRPGSRRWNG